MKPIFKPLKLILFTIQIEMIPRKSVIETIVLFRPAHGSLQERTGYGHGHDSPVANVGFDELAVLGAGAVPLVAEKIP